MKKTIPKPTPKQLLKKRVANHKDLQIPRDECTRKMYGEKQIVPLDVKHDYHKKYFKTHDRQLKDDSYRNPYIVPERLRVTSKCLPPRKQIPEPFIMGDIHTVCDIDPMFYKIVEGRPVRSFYDIKSYLKDIRDITLFRANAGYLHDEIIQIETGNAYEQEEYEKILNHFDKIKEYFVTFAEESYKDAKYMQHLAEMKFIELEAMSEQLEGCSFEFARLKNEISDIVATYENLLRYKIFLTNLAPEWWRERYIDMCEMGTSLCSKLFTQLESEETTSVALYKKSAVSLAQLQPQLYFRRPMELTTLLCNTERQCLHYMEIVEFFSGSLAKVNAYRKQFKEEMIADCTDMQEFIEYFENKVKEMEERKEYFKAEFESILEKQFYHLVASYDVTKLFTCLQYTHTEIFGDKKDPRDSMTSLALNIERLYNTLCTNLEGLNLEVVKVATKQIFDEDIRVMQQARNAERQLKQYNVLCKALYKSFEPSRSKTRC